MRTIVFDTTNDVFSPIVSLLWSPKKKSDEKQALCLPSCYQRPCFRECCTAVTLSSLLTTFYLFLTLTQFRKLLPTAGSLYSLSYNHSETESDNHIHLIYCGLCFNFTYADDSFICNTIIFMLTYIVQISCYSWKLCLCWWTPGGNLSRKKVISQEMWFGGVWDSSLVLPCSTLCMLIVSLLAVLALYSHVPGQMLLEVPRS